MNQGDVPWSGGWTDDGKYVADMLAHMNELLAKKNDRIADLEEMDQGALEESEREKFKVIVAEKSREASYYKNENESLKRELAVRYEKIHLLGEELERAYAETNDILAGVFPKHEAEIARIKAECDARVAVLEQQNRDIRKESGW